MVFKVPSNPGPSTILSFIKTSYIPCYQQQIPSLYEPRTNQAAEAILPAAKVLSKPAPDYLEKTNWSYELAWGRTVCKKTLIQYFLAQIAEVFPHWKCLPGLPPSPVTKNEAKPTKCTLYIPPKPQPNTKQFITYLPLKSMQQSKRLQAIS